MYESPIRLLVQQLETSVREQQEKQIFEAVQKCGVDVDRDELIKALAYDRAQYAQGYSDGRADAQRWISVEDEYPDSKLKVLVIAYEDMYDRGEIKPCPAVHTAYTRGEDEGWFDWYTEDWLHVTHWMPLPEPPKKEDTDD